MKCPLFRMAELIKRDRVSQGDTECLKEECAWWDAPLQICGFRTIGCTLEVISMVLEKLESKMPHAGQFTK